MGNEITECGGGKHIGKKPFLCENDTSCKDSICNSCAKMYDNKHVCVQCFLFLETRSRRKTQKLVATVKIIKDSFIEKKTAKFEVGEGGETKLVWEDFKAKLLEEEKKR